MNLQDFVDSIYIEKESANFNNIHNRLELALSNNLTIIPLNGKIPTAPQSRDT